MRKRIEQFSEWEREKIIGLSIMVRRIWKNGCYRLIVGDNSQPDALVCWQEKDDWIKTVYDLTKEGSGRIPSFPRKRVYGCEVCFYRNVAGRIR